MKTGLLIGAAVLGVLAGRPTPDASLPLVEYRLLAPLGQVRITRGVVQDQDVQQKMLAGLPAFDGQGLVLIADDAVREVRRRETVGGHVIETVLHVYPATGRGYRGGLATADVMVTIDGAREIDCPFVGGSVDLSDVSILPADGFIMISGQVGEKHLDQLVRFTDGQTVDRDWLEQRAR